MVWCENYRAMDSDEGGHRNKRTVSCTMVGGDTREVAEDDEVMLYQMMGVMR